MKKNLFSLVMCTLMLSASLSAQDIIITSNAQKIEAKILEVSKTEIKYKEMDNLDGPTFIISTDEVNSVIYSNGRVAVFENTPKNNNQPRETTSSTQFSDYKEEFTQSNERHFNGYVELSGIFERFDTGFGKKTTGGIGVDDVNGLRFNKYFFLGLGVGVYGEFYTGHVRGYKVSLTTLQSPIFADMRIFMPTRKTGLYPYFETSVGPLFTYYQSISFEGEKESSNNFHTYAFFRTNLGIEYNRFTCGIGYELWGDSKSIAHFGFIKLGVRIGESTY